MTDQMQEEGEYIANEGKLCVLVPDLFRGKTTGEFEEAEHLMADLDWSGAIQDIAAAANFLKAQGCGKVSDIRTPINLPIFSLFVRFCFIFAVFHCGALWCIMFHYV